MKIILPLCGLLLAVLGCGQFGNSAPEINSNAATTPTPKIVVANFPALFGKPLAEIKKHVNGEPTRETPETIEYKIPQGYLNFDTRASVNKDISFQLADNASGRSLDLYARTPQQLADFVGIDLTGKQFAPTSSDSFPTYEDVFGGQPVEITFSKEKSSSGEDMYKYVRVSLKRK